MRLGHLAEQLRERQLVCVRGVLLITHGGAGLVGFDRVLRLDGGRLTGLASDDACGIDTARIDAENGPDAQPAVPSSVRA